MASVKKRAPAYHVVQTFDIAAQGGKLNLGAIFEKENFQGRSIHRLEIPPELLCAPVAHNGVNESRFRLREANIEAWMSAMGRVGVSAGFTREAENTVTCDQIITTAFDPDSRYIADSLEARPVQDYLRARGWKAKLYMITGLKVAKNMQFSSGNVAHGRAEVKAKQTLAPVVGPSINTSLSGDGKGKHDLEFCVTDVVIGYRIHKFRARLRPFSKKKVIRDDGIIEGEMMADKEAGASPMHVEFEEISAAEDMDNGLLVEDVDGWRMVPST